MTISISSRHEAAERIPPLSISRRLIFRNGSPATDCRPGPAPEVVIIGGHVEVGRGGEELLLPVLSRLTHVAGDAAAAAELRRLLHRLPPPPCPEEPSPPGSGPRRASPRWPTWPGGGYAWPNGPCATPTPRSPPWPPASATDRKARSATPSPGSPPPLPAATAAPASRRRDRLAVPSLRSHPSSLESGACPKSLSPTGTCSTPSSPRWPRSTRTGGRSCPRSGSWPRTARSSSP